MGSMSLIHWIILGGILLLVFGGRNKISDVMGDVAKGIKSFKKGLSEDDEKAATARPVEPVRSIDHYPVQQQVPSPAPQPQPVAQGQLDPRMTDPRMADPRMTDPRMTDPRMTDPRMADPRMTDPRVSEPHKAG